MESNVPKEVRLAPELKAKWLEALRSGRFYQGRRDLKNAKDGVIYHCCLGVLQEVAGKPIECGMRSYLPTEDSIEYGLESNYPAIVDIPEYGPVGHVRTQSVLALMNDNDWSFSRIADWIEANL